MQKRDEISVHDTDGEGERERERIQKENFCEGILLFLYLLFCSVELMGKDGVILAYDKLFPVKKKKERKMYR